MFPNLLGDSLGNALVRHQALKKKSGLGRGCRGRFRGAFSLFGRFGCGLLQPLGV